MIAGHDHIHHLPLGGAIAGRGFKERAFQPLTGRPAPENLADEKIGPEAGGGSFLLCARCLRRITRSRERMVVNGSHQHTFVNPHGLMFDLGCFEAAPGCGQLGRPTSELTWFPGYRWQVAVCAGCLFHLGWFFSSTGASFYGLIIGHLIERDEQ